ncbi:MAG: lytic transglycosylase domain-containing protein [Pseudomonadota bacterium]
MRYGNRWVLGGLAVVTVCTVGAAGYWFVPQVSALAPGDARDMRLRAGPPTITQNNDTVAVEGARVVQSTQMAAAFASLAQGDTAAVRAAIADLPDGSVERDTLIWAVAHTARDYTDRDLELARDTLNDWPSTDALQTRADRLAQRSLFADFRLIDRFADREPPTFSLAASYARTQLRAGGEAKARAALLPFWLDRPLSASDEDIVVERFGDILTTEDHARRYFSMMARERVRSGERLKEVAAMAPLHDAWAAVIRNQNDVASLMAAVPEDYQQTTAFTFMRTEYLRKRGEWEAAAEILASASTDPSLAINPDVWWTERRIVSRALRERGQHEDAYEIAAAHQGGGDRAKADALFHAGWYALRGLDDPERALPHFEALAELAQTPLTASRAQYWIARSYSSAGDQEAANEAFAEAARYWRTFYGQLAQSALGSARGQATGLVARNQSSARVTMMEQAITLMLAHNADALAVRFAQLLGADAEDPAVVDSVAQKLYADGKAFAALRMAKAADRRGVAVSAESLHPLGIIDGGAFPDVQPLAFAYAIARQESEFNVAARSSANALGLMQLLPSTAREVARRIGVDYTPERLTTDAGYNARLGVAYARQQLARFGGSYVLTLIAYNAGPGRAREWTRRFGSPQGLPLEELIDWIEQIPFPETRNYVQRVMENYVVYRQRLGLQTDIATVLTQGAPEL